MKRKYIGSACSRYGEGRGAYRILMERPEGMRPIGLILLRIGRGGELS
jgi:hypothetical protein